MKKTFNDLRTGDKILVCDCKNYGSVLLPVQFRIDQIKRIGYSGGYIHFYTESGIYGTAYNLDGTKVWIENTLVWTDISEGIDYYWELLDYLGDSILKAKGYSEIELLEVAEKLRRLEDEVANI